jgi:hypothetical protein
MGRQLSVAVLSPFVAQRLVSVLNNEHCSGLERLAELAAAGQVAPCVEQSYSLAQCLMRSAGSKPETSAAKSSSRSEGATSAKPFAQRPWVSRATRVWVSAVPRSLTDSQAEVAAGGRRERFEWSM